MKLAAVLVVLCLLCGCSTENRDMERVLSFREELLQSSICTFEATVTADYEDTVYTFQMHCEADSTGTLAFTVADPQTIAGITGTISERDAALTFDDEVLAFPMLAEGQATPVTAPWIFMSTLREGYISGCGEEGDGYRISADDSYEDHPLHLEILTNGEMTPLSCEIYWNGYRILSLDIRQFRME